MELMQASHQWATRPSDERFVNLHDLYNATLDQKNNSAQKVVSTRDIQVAPVESDSKALVVLGPDGAPVTPNNWSFGQLCGFAGAPRGYLADLPAELAADNINFCLGRKDPQDMGVLIQRTKKSGNILTAATGPDYGRVWNSTIAKAMIDKFGDGVTGNFRVPGEFGHKVDITKENTTIYGSDRDMFVFLADEERRITIKDRRDGKSGSLARGFFVWNSQVGSRTFGVATFLFDYVCCNRIVWGATDVSQVKFRHTKSAPHKWIEEVAPAISAYAQASSGRIEEVIKAAQLKRVDDVDALLTKRFSKTKTAAIKAVFLAEEDRPIETIWDISTGITALAKQVTHQDERIKLETIAGDIMSKVTV